MDRFKFRAYPTEINSDKTIYEDWQDTTLVEAYGFDGGTLYDVVQFTGMKDCKGVEIYEGDIIKWSTTRYQSCYAGYDPEKRHELITIEWKSPVEWDFCGFSVTEAFDLDQKNNCWLCGANEPLEVIGNIYQPELCK